MRCGWKRAAPALGPAVLIFFAGCSTYQTKIEPARQALAQGRHQEAVSLVEPLARPESKDQVLYTLDLATALQGAGKFRQSAEAFERAARLADKADYISVSRTAGSLVLAEEVQQYKTESYERVLLHALNSLNFLALNDWEGAQVEVRRIHQIVRREAANGRKADLGDGFATFLAGLIWESTGQWDDAAIAYENAHRALGDQPVLLEALVRATLRSQRSEKFAALKRAHPEVAIRVERESRSSAHVFVLRLAGWAPRKAPNPVEPRFPELRSVPWSDPWQIRAGIESQKTDVVLSTVLDVDQIARRALQEDALKLIGRRLSGVVAKEVLADQVSQRDPALGLVTSLLLHASDRADLRQWSTLPAQFQLARLVVPAGNVQMRIEGHDDVSLTLKPNERRFVVVRDY
jgi:hypothetical protein